MLHCSLGCPENVVDFHQGVREHLTCRLQILRGMQVMRLQTAEVQGVSFGVLQGSDHCSELRAALRVSIERFVIELLGIPRLIWYQGCVPLLCFFWAFFSSSFCFLLAGAVILGRN